MPSRGLGAYSVKIHQIVFGGLFLLVTAFAIRGMATGSTSNIKMLATLSVFAGIVLALDKYYWLICPVLLVLPFNIPGLPFGSGELARIILVGMFFVRSALGRDDVCKFRTETLVAALYFFWIVAIFCINPAGMNIFGSEILGGRFYFQILLGFLTLLTFSRLRLTERDARYWMYALLAAQAFKFLMGMVGGYAFVVSGEEATLSNYFLIPATPLLLLLLCHYDLRYIVSFSWRFIVALGLALAVAYSGKRTSMGQVFLAPFLLVGMRKKEKGMLFVLSILAAFVLGFLVVGQGRMYELPFSVQRSMSFLPGKWDNRLENYGTKDLFREELHRRAKGIIKEKPLLGNKGYSIEREQIVWMIAGTRSDSMSGHEYVGNWHNKWYGMAADFGLPAAFFWYVFSIYAAVYCIRHRGVATVGGYKATLFLYYSLYMFYDLFFAFGHSAHTPLTQWTNFGFLLALSYRTDHTNTLTKNKSSV